MCLLSEGKFGSNAAKCRYMFPVGDALRCLNCSSREADRSEFDKRYFSSGRMVLDGCIKPEKSGIKDFILRVLVSMGCHGLKLFSMYAKELEKHRHHRIYAAEKWRFRYELSARIFFPISLSTVARRRKETSGVSVLG